MIDSTLSETRLFTLASEFLPRVAGRDGLVRGMAAYARAAEAEAGGGERAVACRAGCPYCCVLNVTVLLPEAAAIAAWLDERLAPPEVAALVNRLDRQRRLVRWLEDEERIRAQIHCPFLDSAGSCSIHPVRPLACRGVTSLDSGLCHESLDPGSDDFGSGVPMDLGRKLVMDAAFYALGRALREAGAISRGIELSAGVWAFLAFPEMAEQVVPGGSLPPELWE